MAEISNINPNDFITRDDFIEWVLNPTPEADLYWERFLQDNPSRKKDIDEAIFIIKSIIPEERGINSRKLEKLWTAIEKKIINKKHSKRIWWSVAAGLIILTGLSSLLYFFVNSKNELTDYKSIARVGGADEVKLIFSDNSEKTFSSNNLEIKYKGNGEIEVNTADGRKSTKLVSKIQDAGTATPQKTPVVPSSKESSQEQLNQLVVPRGKRTSLTLSDGTRLYLNSGSRAIFPVKFAKEKRELFVEGEAYIEVAHDQKRPFIAVTDEMTVKVLGTKFDISAYPEDSYSSLVLVEGNVQAEVNSQKIVLEPNHLLVYQKETKTTSLEKTEVLPYISWKDGWMYCKQEKLGTITDKLSRYYNVKIEIQGQEVANMSLTGKLDLKSKCSDIFKAISSIAPISCTISDDKIIVSKKENINVKN